jgi:hypothetical protein
MNDDASMDKEVIDRIVGNDCPEESEKDTPKTES